MRFRAIISLFAVGCMIQLVLCVPTAFGGSANDDFAQRSQIQGANAIVTGSLSNATSEVGEPLLNGISSGQTAWWTWTAPSNGLLTISVNASNFNPLVTVFAGNQLDNLALVASNNYLICYADGDCGCHWRVRDQLSFHVFRGQPYQISVDSLILTDGSMGWSTNPAIQEWSGVLEFTTIPQIDPMTGEPIGPPPLLYGVTFTTNVVPGSDVALKLQFTPAPPNDDFASAKVIKGSRVQLAVSNAGATKEFGEPDHAGNPGGSSVWFSWKAPASGRVTLSTNEIAPFAPPAWWGYTSGGYYGEFNTQIILGPAECGDAIDQNPPPVFYPLLAAYTGTGVSVLTPANCLPVGLDAYPYAIEFDVAQGRIYNFAVDGNMGTTNRMSLYVALTTPAINDTFARRIRVQGTYVAASGYNAGAVTQTNAPDIGNGSTGKLAWWSWTAPVDGNVSINLDGSDYTFPLAVFAGAKIETLELVGAGTGAISFAAKTGQSYQIAVGDASGLTGEIKLVIQAPVVAAPLLDVRRGSSSALLRFSAASGQVLQLQRLGATKWINLQKAVAHLNEVDFYVKPVPATNDGTIRAIVVNYISQQER